MKNIIFYNYILKTNTVIQLDKLKSHLDFGTPVVLAVDELQDPAWLQEICQYAGLLCL